MQNRDILIEILYKESNTQHQRRERIHYTVKFRQVKTQIEYLNLLPLITPAKMTQR
jgi:hypothetical protein